MPFCTTESMCHSLWTLRCSAEFRGTLKMHPSNVLCAYLQCPHYSSPRGKAEENLTLYIKYFSRSYFTVVVFNGFILFYI
uniref:Uncharacterized protein n=1 Tax=Anguilla anguilla TaxID=7936 RepID=A0A0E9WRD9_ANGAN